MGYLAPLKSIKRCDSGIWISLHLINTISHSAVNWAATIWQKDRCLKKSSSGIYTSDIVGLVCSASECDCEWKAVRASRGRQPGNPTFLRPPSASVGGGWQEKGGTANDGNLRRFPFSSLDSYSPEIFHPPPHHRHSHHHHHVPITVPSARHCITDWLTDWPTHRLSLLLLLCFIIFYLIHIHADPLYTEGHSGT